MTGSDVVSERDHFGGILQWIVIGGGLIFFVVFGLVSVFLGRPHVDEGFYFFSPWLVSQGLQPYRDFIYTQTPLHAYIYSLYYSLGFPPDYAATRILSLLFGFGAVLGAVFIAARRGGRLAMSLCVLFLCFNAFLVYMFTQAKLYPLTGFFLTIGVAFVMNDRRSLFLDTAAGIFFGLSVCVRISMLPVLPMFGLYLIIRYRWAFWRIVGPFFASLAVVAGICGYSYLQASEQFLYTVITYNYAKDVQPLWMSIMLRFDVMSKVSHEFFLLCAVAFFLIMYWCFDLHQRSNPIRTLVPDSVRREPGRVLLFLTIAGVGGLQAVSKSGVVDEYLTPIIPLCAAVCASELAMIMRKRLRRDLLVPVLTFFMLLSALQFLSYGRTSLTLMDGKSPIRYYQEVSSYLSGVTKPGDRILSFNNSFVLLANREIVPGYEMHSATHDPDWDEDRCRRFHILSMSSIIQMLQNEEIAAVLMGPNSFIGRFPDFYNPGEVQMRDQMLEIMSDHYCKVRTFPELGYFQTDIHCYVARKIVCTWPEYTSDESSSQP